ncbi:hypothetical protein JZO70_21125 [Enterococcus sp. 669A]|uniref:Uncharacterized protein n=1 Tax=Candidatus Enterococcus moelleringii TaxID=2815325 RepID=A0ABS3LGD3_9ENTE|nr:hypothetical protein [Enterococcus sp. 669A]MBO1308690.1 hypothetical protein [Enterococcus sp. 669A]
MKSLFEEINDRMLGEVGRGIVAFLIENKYLFLVLFAIYGFVLLYSKIVYMYYVPTKIKKIVTENPSLTTDQLYTKWKKEKGQAPGYLLIPSKNEMWVKPLNRSNGCYQMLYFNRKSSYASELDMIEKISEDLKGDFHLG